MRLDLALASRGLARSRSHAASLIAGGRVWVTGVQITKAAHQVSKSDEIAVQGERWVSRAAHKLVGALADSATTIPARVLDAGASTGGFTQVCLDYGAERVYAIDVGHGQLAAKLRGDPRVVVREGLNLRQLTLDDVESKPVDLVVGDVSFISLRLLLAPLTAVLSLTGEALLLVKPQFEVGRERLGGGGIVRDESMRRDAVDSVVQAASLLGWICTWRGMSCLPGASGNIEYFIRLARDTKVRV